MAAGKLKKTISVDIYQKCLSVFVFFLYFSQELNEILWDTSRCTGVILVENLGFLLLLCFARAALSFEANGSDLRIYLDFDALSIAHYTIGFHFFFFLL